MAGYSLDLRERIIKAVVRGDQTKRDIATLFEVHESFIKQVRQQRERGHFAPLAHGGGHPAKLQDEQLAVLRQLVAQTPDATLDNLGTQLQHQMSMRVSRTTLWRGLAALGVTRKKRLKPLKRIR